MTVLRWLTTMVVVLAVLGPTGVFAQSEKPTSHIKMKMSEKQSKSKMQKTSEKVTQQKKQYTCTMHPEARK